MYFSWLVFIALFTFAASTLYFYIFSRKQEKFMQYWGFSWIAYSMSLLCLLSFFASPNDLFLELRKVVLSMLICSCSCLDLIPIHISRCLPTGTAFPCICCFLQ